MQAGIGRCRELFSSRWPAAGGRRFEARCNLDPRCKFLPKSLAPQDMP